MNLATLIVYAVSLLNLFSFLFQIWFSDSVPCANSILQYFNQFQTFISLICHEIKRWQTTPENKTAGESVICVCSLRRQHNGLSDHNSVFLNTLLMSYYYHYYSKKIVFFIHNTRWDYPFFSCKQGVYLSSHTLLHRLPSISEDSLYREGWESSSPATCHQYFFFLYCGFPLWVI